jgi:hypothetical protein
MWKDPVIRIEGYESLLRRPQEKLYNCIKTLVNTYDVCEFLGKQLPVGDKHDIFVDE